MKRQLDKVRDYMEHAENRLKRLLGPQDASIYGNFEYDKEGLMSMTKFSIAEDVCTWLLDSGVPNTATITDAFAGLGANTILFAQHFGRVAAVECNSDRCNKLCHNVRLFGLDNVLVYNTYYQSVARTTRIQDVIFFDPPWGPDYDPHKKNIRLTIRSPGGKTSVDLEALVANVAESTTWAVLKLPKNYDMAYMAESMRLFYTIEHEMVTDRPYSSLFVYMKSI